MSGKTALVKCISEKAVQDYIMFEKRSAEFEQWELPVYDETTNTEVGVQLIDFPDSMLHPIYLRMYDTPGD